MVGRVIWKIEYLLVGRFCLWRRVLKILEDGLGIVFEIKMLRDTVDYSWMVIPIIVFQDIWVWRGFSGKYAVSKSYSCSFLEVVVFIEIWVLFAVVSLGLKLLVNIKIGSKWPRFEWTFVNCMTYSFREYIIASRVTNEIVFGTYGVIFRLRKNFWVSQYQSCIRVVESVMSICIWFSFEVIFCV